MPRQLYSTRQLYGTRQLCCALAVALAALVLVPSSNALAAGSAGGARAAFAAPHPHGFGAFRHFRRHNGVFTYWPGYGYGEDGYGYGPSAGAPLESLVPPVSNDVHYTYTYDVPWDWAHRFPPMVAPSDRPYVPGCHDEPVTVPGRGGERTINVTRCY